MHSGGGGGGGGVVENIGVSPVTSQHPAAGI